MSPGSTGGCIGSLRDPTLERGHYEHVPYQLLVQCISLAQQQHSPRAWSAPATTRTGTPRVVRSSSWVRHSGPSNAATERKLPICSRHREPFCRLRRSGRHAIPVKGGKTWSKERRRCQRPRTSRLPSSPFLLRLRGMTATRGTGPMSILQRLVTLFVNELRWGVCGV